MPRTDKLSTYRTAWDETGVTYVNTRIVAWEGDNVTLNSGGWRTVTTKRKMNQASNQFALRYSVFQRKGDWYVNVKGTANTFGALDMPFVDGMTFNRFTGAIVR